MGYKGLQPVTGSCGKTNEYTVDASNSVAIYKYDGVVAEADGNVTALANTKSNNFLGSVVKIMDTDGLVLDELPASTAGKVVVTDDPDQEYLIESATGIAAADRFGSFNLANTSVTGVNGYSQAQLSATIGTSNQFKVIDAYKTQSNDWAATNGAAENTIVRVKANAHYFNSTPDALTS